MTWDHLHALAHELPESGAESAWLERLREELTSLPADHRAEAVADVARQLAASRAATHWTGQLAAAADTVSRHLALALAAWLPVPLERSLVELLQPLLGEKRIPGAVRLDAATVLLQTTGADGPAAEAVLRAFLARTGKARAVDRLRLLMQRLGKSPMLEQWCTRLEAQVRMRCPRCRTQMRRPEMAQHLWVEHGLVLEGRKVREPWHLVADWIAEHRRWGNPELLDRCRELAQRLDGAQGLARVHRLFLAQGVEDDAARAALREQARNNHASLCPACFALVPVPRGLPVQPLSVSHGRLSGHGCTVEVSERGLAPMLEIATPTGTVYRGPEPGRRLTRRGAMLLLAGPPVLLALAAGLVLTLLGSSGLWPVVLPLAVALLLACGIQLYWLTSPEPVARAVDHAWTRLVPRLHLGGDFAEESNFLAGLARLSLRHGTPALRAEERRRLLREAEQAVRTGQSRLAHLAALQVLAAADAAAEGEDAAALLTAQLRRCFVGELPLAFAEELLHSEKELPVSPADRPRLRVLLCDAAFEAGLEVRDLLAAAQAAPALGALLDTGRREMLAPLRLLWSLRPRKPWRKWGDARTAFELAAGPPADAELFHRYPDLLLADLEPPWIFLTRRGVVFRESVFRERPSRIGIHETSDGAEITYELIVADARFAFWHNPTTIRSRLEGWLHFWFDDFLPRLAEVAAWQPPGPPRTLVAQEAAGCPECRTLLWTRWGEVGQPVTRGPEQTPEPAAQAG